MHDWCRPAGPIGKILVVVNRSEVVHPVTEMEEGSGLFFSVLEDKRATTGWEERPDKEALMLTRVNHYLFSKLWPWESRSVSLLPTALGLASLWLSHISQRDPDIDPVSASWRCWWSPGVESFAFSTALSPCGLGSSGPKLWPPSWGNVTHCQVLHCIISSSLFLSMSWVCHHQDFIKWVCYITIQYSYCSGSHSGPGKTVLDTVQT